MSRFKEKLVHIEHQKICYGHECDNKTLQISTSLNFELMKDRRDMISIAASYVKPTNRDGEKNIRMDVLCTEKFKQYVL